MTSKILKVGLVGAGAVANKYYLPILRKAKDIRIVALIDDEPTIKKKLEPAEKGTILSGNYRDALGRVDVIFLTLPNYLHAEVAIEFLENGTNVFCEKPLSTNFKDAKSMVEMAKANNVKLGAGMVRRYFTVIQKAKELLDTQFLGRVLNFDYEEGSPFDWPLKSKYLFDQNQAGGGVLIDTGSHVLDLLTFLFGKPSRINYRDDSHGGVEANCQLELTFGRIKGRVELSRDRNLRNTFLIYCEKGNFELPSGETGYLKIIKYGNEKIIKTTQTFKQAFNKEILDYIKAVRLGANFYISGHEILDSMAAIDYCYKNKKEIKESWL